MTQCGEETIRIPIRPGEIIIHPERLDIPLGRKKPTVWAIWNDAAHEEVNWGFFGSMIGRIAECPQHIFLLLTKRPERLKGFMEGMCYEWRTLPNLWLGVTVVNQPEADEKIPLLLQIPAAVRWVSIEPMLGPVDLLAIPAKGVPGYAGLKLSDMLHWVVLGGESGPGARPMHPDWVRALRDQCQEAGVTFFFKQWGEWGPDVLPGVPVFKDTGRFDEEKGMVKYGKKLAGRLLDGREWNELPKWKNQ
jgi:protein gp37